MAISAPLTDPSMTIVSRWVDAAFPSLLSFFTPAAGTHGVVPYTTFEVPDAMRDAAVYRCAIALAARRLAPNPIRFFSWLARLAWAEPLAPDAAAQMRVPLLVNLGTPTARGNASHVLGLIAETLWYEVTGTLPTPDGLPILIEGHDWSVTDPGGDGLAVYRSGASLYFTLWESKAHRTQAEVRPTVNGACRQLQSHALDYLGRFSIVAQRTAPDEETARFLCLLSEQWADKAETSRVAVSVTTQLTSDASDCFGNMPSYFGFPDDRHSGRLFRISNYRKFCVAVRRLIWKGCGL